MSTPSRKSKSSGSEPEERDFRLNHPYSNKKEKAKYIDSEYESLNIESDNGYQKRQNGADEASIWRWCFSCFFPKQNLEIDYDTKDGYYRGSIYDDTEMSEHPQYPDLSIKKRSSDQPFDDEEIEFDLDDTPFDSAKEVDPKPAPVAAPIIPTKPEPPKKSGKIILSQVARMEISSDDNDDYNDMKEPSVESEEETIIEPAKITDCISLSDVDLSIFKELILNIDKQIAEYKRMHRSFENTIRRSDNTQNRLRLDQVRKVLSWIENGKREMVEFSKNVEKKRTDSNFYLSEGLDQFMEFYIDFFKSDHLTNYLRNEKPDFRLLPPHPSLPHVMNLKNNHSTK